MKVKIISAILHEGKHVEVGKVIDVPDNLAKELVYLNKAEWVGTQAAPDEGKSKK